MRVVGTAAWWKPLAGLVVAQAGKGSFGSADGSLREPSAPLRMTRCCSAACVWLGAGLVLLVPDVGFLFDGCGLGAGHVGG
jgi:hypothetical protein